jgi:hypothetical protein
MRKIFTTDNLAWGLLLVNLIFFLLLLFKNPFSERNLVVLPFSKSIPNHSNRFIDLFLNTSVIRTLSFLSDLTLEGINILGLNIIIV